MILGGVNADTVWLFAAWVLVRPPLDAANDRVFGGLVRGRTAIRHHASGRAAVGAFVRRTLAGLSFLAAWLRRERSLWGNDGRNR